MFAARDSTAAYSARVECCRILGQVFSATGQEKEARKYLHQGRKLAENAGMKGEIKRFEALLTKQRSL